MTSPYQLTLDYQLHPGWLEPYIQSLKKGTAMARCCDACKKISFPPIRVCECQHTGGNWLTLSGKAYILNRCEGTEGDFAMVQFDGADTKTVVRLDNVRDTDSVGCLKVSQSEHEVDKLALVLTSYKHGEIHD